MTFTRTARFLWAVLLTASAVLTAAAHSFPVPDFRADTTRTPATTLPDSARLSAPDDLRLVSAGIPADTVSAPADTTLKTPARRDTLVEVTHALRIGVDLAAPLMPLISGKDNDKGWMVMADYRLTPRLYAAANFGYSERSLNFSSMRNDFKGYYALAGVHYALIQGAFLQKKNKKESLDLLFAGAKIGYSRYDRRLYDATIKGSYWGAEHPLDIADRPSALWLDLSVGITVCLWNEFYLSMQGGYDVMISQSDKNGIGPLAVPGIGQVYNKSTAFSLSYGLSYRIPLYKRTHRIRLREKRESVQERRAAEEAEKKKNFTPAFTPSVPLLEE